MKVKERAKKIKNKLTKHGQGHENDQHDPDEEDGEEEEDLEVHGATSMLFQFIYFHLNDLGHSYVSW